MAPGFDVFLDTFLGSLAKDDFYQNQSLSSYLRLPAERRSNDEADVVDDKVSNLLIRALGYSAGEKVYNRPDESRRRPDFTLRIPAHEYPKPCAVIESKNTATKDLESHLPQLEGYLRSQGAQRGILLDGKRLLAYELTGALLVPTADLSLSYLVDLWRGESLYAEGQKGLVALPDSEKTKLRAFWQRFSRASYTDSSRLVLELTRTQAGQPHALDGSTWNRREARFQLRKPDDKHFIAEVRELIGDVRTDVEAQLTLRLERYKGFKKQLDYLPGSAIKASDEYQNHLDTLLVRLAALGLSAEVQNRFRFRLEDQLERPTERDLPRGVGADILEAVKAQL